MLRQIMFSLLGVTSCITGAAANEHNTLAISTIADVDGQHMLDAAASAVPTIVATKQRIESNGDQLAIVVDLVLVNPLDVPVTYYGYRMDSWTTRPPAGEINPFYRVEIKERRDDAWCKRGVGRCGTGAGYLIVPPKHAGRFSVRIASPGGSARVGINCTWTTDDEASTTLIWSAAIPTSTERFIASYRRSDSLPLNSSPPVLPDPIRAPAAVLAIGKPPQSG